MAETIAGYAALYDTETVIAGLFRGKTAAAQEDVPPELLGTLAKQRLQAVHYLRASHVERGCCGLREVGLEYREKRLSATDNHGSAIAAHLHHRVLDLSGRRPLDRDIISGSALRRRGTVLNSKVAPMWSGFDPDFQQQWKAIREMVVLQHRTPTREWPLVLVEEHDALLVVREWPNGSITSYAVSVRRDTEQEKP